MEAQSQVAAAAKPQEKTQKFKVADLSLAEWGRKEISIAEHEMPGLMAIRAEFASQKPSKEGGWGQLVCRRRLGLEIGVGNRELSTKTVLPGGELLLEIAYAFRFCCRQVAFFGEIFC